jgi:hypothetical protein
MGYCIVFRIIPCIIYVTMPVRYTRAPCLLIQFARPYYWLATAQRLGGGWGGVGWGVLGGGRGGGAVSLPTPVNEGQQGG